MILNTLLTHKSAQAIEKRTLKGWCLLDINPCVRRIVVRDRRTDTYVASTVTKINGYWEFKNLPVFPDRVLVAVSYDDTTQTNTEVYDYLSQVL